MRDGEQKREKDEQMYYSARRIADLFSLEKPEYCKPPEPLDRSVKAAFRGCKAQEAPSPGQSGSQEDTPEQGNQDSRHPHRESPKVLFPEFKTHVPVSSGQAKRSPAHRGVLVAELFVFSPAAWNRVRRS